MIRKVEGIVAPPGTIVVPKGMEKFGVFGPD
jgi:hypothetical protein